MPASAYIKNAYLTWRTGSVFPSAPVTLYVSLHTANPNDTGLNEVSTSGTGYLRQPINSTQWSAIVTGTPSTIASTVDCRFPPASGSGYSILYGGIWDAATGGHFLEYQFLANTNNGTSAISVSAGNTYDLPTGSVTGSVS